jgi:hypothetical protein
MKRDGFWRLVKSGKDDVEPNFRALRHARSGPAEAGLANEKQ